MTGTRISKHLADCGVASRRKAEEIVLAGRVQLNGETVTDLGRRVMPSDELRLDGKPLTKPEGHLYILLNKPRGYLTTSSDDRGRKTVMQLVETHGHRVFPVGRLDMDTEGLLLLTDDGELAFRLTHPRKMVEKVYVASLKEPLKEDSVERMRIGIMLEGSMTAPANVRILHPSGLMIEVSIHEGRKRQVRRMVEEAGSKVISLKRIRLGPLELGKLAPGEWRHLTQGEVEELMSLGPGSTEGRYADDKDDQEQ